MKKVSLCLCAVFLVSMSFAADSQTKEQKVIALVEKGIASIKSLGKEKTLAEINTPKGKLSEGDLYLFVNDLKGVTLAHGGNQKMIGQNQNELLDADGKPFIQEMIKIASTDGKGWVNYKWTNPATKKIQDKAAYIMKVEGQDYFIGCGYYK
jgi:cytochrome c